MVYALCQLSWHRLSAIKDWIQLYCGKALAYVGRGLHFECRTHFKFEMLKDKGFFLKQYEARLFARNLIRPTNSLSNYHDTFIRRID